MTARSARIIMRQSYRASLRALAQLAALDAARHFLETRIKPGVDGFHLEPDFGYGRVARAELRAAHALRTQRAEACLRRFFGAEHAERKRPAERAVVLHDEIVVDVERLELGRLLLRRRTAALRRNEHPPARGFLGATLREARAELQRLERRLRLRGIGEREAAPLEALQHDR